jgi:hypothetical protein
MKKKLTKQNQESLEYIIAPAIKLAILLHSSTMPTEVKEAWLALLPEMSLKQISEFLDILEGKYLDEQTKNIDDDYQQKLKKLFAKYKKEDEDYKNRVLKQIKELEKHL